MTEPPAYRPSPDLEILVETPTASRPSILKVLLKSNRTDLTPGNYKPYGPFKLNGNRRDYWERFFTQIDNLPTNRPAEAERKMAAKGSRLFEAFPEELQAALWSIWSKVSKEGKALAVWVQSKEPWVPWELLKLSGEDEGRISAGPFLCEGFATTRWLHGIDPVDRLPVTRLALVAPRGDGVEGAPAELAALDRLASQHGVKITRVSATLADVTAAMAGGTFDAWHFTGHGLEPRGPDADAAAILLENSEQLTVENLSGEARNLGRTHPLVFLNACYTGRSGEALGDHGGWARQFLRLGAGAFLGAFWAIDGGLAARFCEAFYRRFLGGMPMAQAVFEARQEIGRPGAATRLAYTVFAHPFAARGRAAEAPGEHRTEEPRPFFGRKEEREKILKQLRGENVSARRILAIDGLGGVGKTELAMWVVRKVQEEGRFDHVIWETAKKEDFDGSGTVGRPSAARLTVERVVARIGDKLGFSADLNSARTQAERLYACSLRLGQTPTLVVLDNLETVDEYRSLVREIQPLFEKGSYALLTSRYSLQEFDAVQSYPLEGLPDGAAREFLRHELQDRDPLHPVDLDEQSLLAIRAATQGLPLAMKLIVGQLMEGTLPLDEVLSRLQAVDWSKPDDLYVQFYDFIYRAIWQQLSQDAQRLLAVMYLFPAGQGRTRERIEERARYAHIQGTAFEGALRQLIRARLLELGGSRAAPSYSLHPLTRNFVHHQVSS